MTLRDHFEKDTREELPLLEHYEYDHEGYYSDTANYFTEYSKWLETKLQNTSSNSDYAKFPTIVAIVDHLNGGKNLGWTCGDVEPIVKAIKELGNFA